ncbi:lipoprotein [Mycoplasma feriruminatoris]|uniref:Prolipoprotein n=1 Tax=Mycoplasma feriruminatoris TaxID=1179777 RepID=A0AAQ3HWS5_9MOLU|nr:lipoprotein [Mycoplasma feriruminatoris]WFQ93657.1 prolipoprotein [Mycoplasma feriruminatoris]WFQ95322.1 prolipoprotein [Mycoplasma feriruminatoris]
MKGLITILGSVNLIAGTSFLAIACKTPSLLNSKLEKIDKETKEYDKRIKENKTTIESSEGQNTKKEINYISDKGTKKNQKENRKNYQDQLMQGDKSMVESKYIHQKTKEENFRLIGEYGKELLDFAFSNQEKLNELKTKPETKHLSPLVKTINNFYVEQVAKRENVKALEKELESKFKSENETKSFSEFLEELYTKWDKAVVQYEKEKDNIWKLLRSI